MVMMSWVARRQGAKRFSLAVGLVDGVKLYAKFQE